jgi:hypothetical protein
MNGIVRDLDKSNVRLKCDNLAMGRFSFSRFFLLDPFGLGDCWLVACATAGDACCISDGGHDEVPQDGFEGASDI